MSDSYDYDLVCIGSGPAGQRAAVQAAKLGHRAAVVEKRRAVGGVSIDTGTIPSKTLREAVVTFSGLAGKGDRLPWAKLDARPTCQQLFSGIDIVIARETEVVENQLRRNDVTLLSGEASFVDPHTLMIRSNGGWRQISSEQILIAVGTHPAHPPGIRADGEVILNTDDVVKLKQLPRTLAVVGAGVIGIEYTFRFGEAVESIEVADGPPRKAVLHLESGKRIVTDMVLYSAGRIAATDALNLLNAGLAADERGRVTVDDCFRTAVPNISVFNYPTLAECYKVAALDASNKLRY